MNDFRFELWEIWKEELLFLTYPCAQ